MSSIDRGHQNLYGGWVKQWRCMNDIGVQCGIFDAREPYSKREAYNDLFLMASYQDEIFNFNGEVINVTAGTVITSYLKLSEKWNWGSSDKKVRKWLKRLEAEGFISIVTIPRKRTEIHLLYWNETQNETDAEKDVAKDVTEDATEDAEKSLILSSKNRFSDATKDAEKDVVEDAQKGDIQEYIKNNQEIKEDKESNINNNIHSLSGERPLTPAEVKSSLLDGLHKIFNGTSNDWFTDFVLWYLQEYWHTFNRNHKPLYSIDITHICDSFYEDTGNMIDYDFDYELFCDMARNYFSRHFKNYDVDYNIKHFLSWNILKFAYADVTGDNSILDDEYYQDW